jgi:hypothetical protein
MPASAALSASSRQRHRRESLMARQQRQSMRNLSGSTGGRGSGSCIPSERRATPDFEEARFARSTGRRHTADPGERRHGSFGERSASESGEGGERGEASSGGIPEANPLRASTPTSSSTASNVCGAERLNLSMPTLRESVSRRSVDETSSALDSSARTNPELFLSGHDEVENDEQLGVELRRRTKPHDEDHGRQPLEDRGGSESVQKGEMPNNASGLSKDTFHDQTERRAERRRSSIDDFMPDPQWPSWMDPLCSVRIFSGKVINNDIVQSIILLLIVINAIMMGIGTFSFVKTNPDLLAKFELTDLIFLILFTIESSMQLFYHGWKLFKDGFLVFDLLIVVLSWAMEEAQVFRAFRIFRTIRLITRIQTLKNLVSALFSVIPKMTAIFMLLMLIFYIFSVMFTQLFKDMYADNLVEEPYFSTIYDSLFTLFQMMTLDEWAEILFQIQITYSWAWLPFVAFIVITGFVVVNLIIAVICDAVHVLAETGKAGLHGDSEESEGGHFYYEDDVNYATPPATYTQQRLEVMQRQLDEMTKVQEHMGRTIELLVRRLGENGVREEELVPIPKKSEDSKGSMDNDPSPPDSILISRKSM